MPPCCRADAATVAAARRRVSLRLRRFMLLRWLLYAQRQR